MAASTGRLAMWIYLAFAVCVLPFLVPLAIRAVEPDGLRRRAMALLAAAGAVLPAVYLLGLVQGPAEVRVEGQHLAFKLHMEYGGPPAAVFTCAGSTGRPRCGSTRLRPTMAGLVSVLQGSPTPSPSGAPPHGDPIPPLLRGWLHVVCFFLSVPAGAVVIAAGGSGRARSAAVVYAFGMTAMFGVSAVYHRRRWSPRGRRWMRRTDHATIFLMIAGSYTPLCLLALRESIGGAVLVAVWAAAALGFAFALTGIAEKAVLGLLCYIGLGWAMVLALPELSRQLSGTEVALLFAGGILYTLGGVVLGTHWPNPSPRWFGYHEVWHTMVVLACACHYVTILSVVRAAP